MCLRIIFFVCTTKQSLTLPMIRIYDALYDAFFFGIFCLENLYLFYLHITLFLSLCTYHYEHKQVHYQILYSLNC